MQGVEAVKLTASTTCTDDKTVDKTTFPFQHMV